MRNKILINVIDQGTIAYISNLLEIQKGKFHINCFYENIQVDKNRSFVITNHNFHDVKWWG